MSVLGAKCLNTEVFWSVFSRILTEKFLPGKTPHLDTFHAVSNTKSNNRILSNKLSTSN